MEVNKLSLFRFLLFTMMLSGSFAYALGGDSYEKQMNLIVILFSLTGFLMYTIMTKEAILKPSLGFKVLLFVLFWMILMSVLQNSVSEWLPTVARYLLFIIVFSVSYMLAFNGSIDEKLVDFVLVACLLIGTVSGFVELITGNVRFVNGAFRVAGNFNHHHLGYALYMFVPLTYVGHKLLENFSLKLFLIWFLGLIMFASSQSRALMMLLVLLFAFSMFYWQESYRKKVFMILLGGLMLFLMYLIILSTDLFPRLKELLVVDELDPSTLYRIFVYEASTSHMSIYAKVFGIGAGGFNDFFQSATGISGTAAHNDYLLVFVEGGCAALFGYLLYQFLILKYFYDISLIDKSPGYALKASFSLFLFLEVFGFLLNAHYFYQSEVMLCLILGVAQGIRRKQELDYE